MPNRDATKFGGSGARYYQISKLVIHLFGGKRLPIENLNNCLKRAPVVLCFHCISF